MSRFDITLGLLASLATIAVIAVYGTRESQRMASAEVGWESRSIETGAALFDQYCSLCHGPNASGAMCPPLDESSGLHGGDLGPGVACRLEELGWSKDDAYGYVLSVIQTGRQYSTRPLLYAGNRVTPTPGSVGPGTPTPKASLPLAAMPAWAQQNGGPLRPDQIEDIARYIVNFRSALPEDPRAAKSLACDPARIQPQEPVPASATPTQTMTATAGTPGTPGADTAGVASGTVPTTATQAAAAGGGAAATPTAAAAAPTASPTP
jgi:hypothetical protein